MFLSVLYDKKDSLYVRSIGYENNSSLAHWGPGKREYGILHYVLQGEGYFNGEKVGNNQGFYISPSQLHEYRSDTNNPWKYFWIILSKELAEKYVTTYINPDGKGIFSYNFADNLLESYNALTSENNYEISHTDALAFFFKLLSFHSKNEKEVFSYRANHVALAKEFIDKNYQKKITVRDVADAIHIDDRYLYNLFVKYENCSPKQYMEKKKIKSAKFLLENTMLSVKEISNSLGFDDVSFFSGFFKRQTGLSPTAYRYKVLSRDT